jgi:hypothetical protein
MSLLFEYFRKNFTLHYNLSGIEIDYGNVNSNSISICKNCNDLFWDGLNDIEEDKIVWKIQDFTIIKESTISAKAIHTIVYDLDKGILITGNFN